MKDTFGNKLQKDQFVQVVCPDRGTARIKYGFIADFTKQMVKIHFVENLSNRKPRNLIRYFWSGTDLDKKEVPDIRPVKPKYVTIHPDFVQ